jgi:hypothetical protein
LGQILCVESPWYIDGSTSPEYFGSHLILRSLDPTFHPC